MDSNTFYIDGEPSKIKATILTNFEIYGDNYCVYTLDDDLVSKKKVYCAKIVDRNLVKIEDKEEKMRTDKIVMTLLNALKV